MSRRLSRRNFLRFTATAAAGSVLAACGGQVPAGAPANAPEATAGAAAPTAAAAPAQGGATTLTVWIQEPSANAAKGAIEGFKQRNPEVTLNIVPTPIAETSAKLLSAISAGSGAPDLAFIQYNDMIQFTSRGGEGLADMTELISNKNEFVSWSLGLATANGKLYGFPSDLGVMGTFYRRDAFDEAGLPSDPEAVAQSIATWDDFLATGAKLKQAGKFMVSSAQEVFNLAVQQEEQAYFDTNGEPIVNSPRYVEAAQLAKRVQEAGIAANFAAAEGSAAMQQGLIATYFSAAWFDIIIELTAPETRGQWGVVGLPNNSRGNLGGSYYVIPQQSQQKEAAWNFVRSLLATEEGVADYMKGIKFLPAWKPIYDTPVFTTPDPNYDGQVWLQQFVEVVDAIPPIRLTPHDGIAAEAVTQAITRVVEEGADPQESLDQANEEIKARLPR